MDFRKSESVIRKHFILEFVYFTLSFFARSNDLSKIRGWSKLFIKQVYSTAFSFTIVVTLCSDTVQMICKTCTPKWKSETNRSLLEATTIVSFLNPLSFKIRKSRVKSVLRC